MSNCRLAITNASPLPDTLDFPTSLQCEFITRRVASFLGGLFVFPLEVWRSSYFHNISHKPTSLLFKPGETKVFTALWTFKQSGDEGAPPGDTASSPSSTARRSRSAYKSRCSERMNLALTGFMGAGKTTVGRRLARMIGMGFADSDAEIARVHGPIAEIFAKEGEARFRAHEREALERLCATDGFVIAVGGGAVLDPRNRALLRRRCLVVHLAVSPEAAHARVAHRDAPAVARRSAGSWTHRGVARATRDRVCGQ